MGAALVRPTHEGGFSTRTSRVWVQRGGVAAACRAWSGPGGGISRDHTETEPTQTNTTTETMTKHKTIDTTGEINSAAARAYRRNHPTGGSGSARVPADAEAELAQLQAKANSTTPGQEPDYAPPVIGPAPRPLAGGRHVQRQLHRRVQRLHTRWREHLHCELPAQEPTEGATNAISMAHIGNPKLIERLRTRALDLAAVTPYGAAHKDAGRRIDRWVMPLATLEEALHEAVLRQPYSHETRERLYFDAYRWAQAAKGFERSARVCAHWAIEMAVAEAGQERRNALGHAPHRWCNGLSAEAGPIAPADLQGVALLPNRLDVARETQIIEAVWTPNRDRRSTGLNYWSDHRRPPVEAMALLADLFHEREPGLDVDLDDLVDDIPFGFAPISSASVSTPTNRELHVLALGLGHSVGAQVLSACLNSNVVVHAVDPEHTCRGHMRRALQVQYDMVVVGCAVEHGVPPTLISKALKVNPGAVVALVSEINGHHAVRQGFEAVLNLRPHPMLDTTDRAVLIRYPTKPWSPLGVPAATDRLLSVWRVD